jgi:hypothetical protein
LKQQFWSQDTVKDVIEFVKKNRTDKLTSDISLMMPFPRKKFENQQSFGLTLQQADLVPKAVLHVLVKDSV